MPIGHSNFANAVAFTPGVGPGQTGGVSRIGDTQNENNFMMNGVSAMDTGNNGQMLSLNIESIAEVKAITLDYPGGIRQSERSPSHGRDQERHECTPRGSLRYLDQFELEFKVVGESEERHATGV